MVKKIGIVLIFGGICFVFVFMGYNTFGPSTSGYAARVNNTIIPIVEHNMASNRLIGYYTQLFGENLPLQTEQIRSMALEQIITQEATAQAIQEEGLLVVPAFLKDTIVSIPAFQRGGRFQRDLYDQYLQQQRLSSVRFEEKMQRDLSMDLARNFFETHLSPTSLEVQKTWLIRNTQINVQFVKINSEDLLETLDIPSDDLKAYLENEEHLQTLESLYNNNKDSYTSEAQVKVQHILIKDEAGEEANGTSQKADLKEETSQKESALARIQSIQERAKTEDFSQLAIEFSEDPGSQQQGGDLGYVTKGELVPEFEEVAFSLDVGQISEPVKTSFGYHLIKVLDRKSSQTKSFEDMQEGLAKEALVEEKVDEAMGRIRELLRGDDLEALNQILKGLNIEKWEETGLYALDDETIPQIGSFPEAINASLSLINQSSVLYPRVVSEGKNNYLFKLKDKQIPALNNESKDLVSLKEQIQRASARNAFEKWTDHVKDNTIIETNSLILQ